MTTTRNHKAHTSKPPQDLDAQLWGPGLDGDTAAISIPADRWDWHVAS